MGTERSFEAAGPAGPHKIAYMDWGNCNNPNVLVCVHGLTRNSRDFDVIADVFDKEYRVICVDIAGRGESDWLKCSSNYSYPQYISDIISLLQHLKVGKIDWLGTSMGGILGMFLAALPDSPIQKLVINDIGPLIPSEALRRISRYLGKSAKFSSIIEVELYLRDVHAAFGPLTDQQWAHLAVHSARADTSGEWTLTYDPMIADAFGDVINQDIDLWDIWHSITCPTLMLRGENSDVLPIEIAVQARTCGPQPILHQFANVGHAPALMADDQIQYIQRWLAG